MRTEQVILSAWDKRLSHSNHTGAVKQLGNFQLTVKLQISLTILYSRYRSVIGSHENHEYPFLQERTVSAATALTHTHYNFMTDFVGSNKDIDE